MSATAVQREPHARPATPPTSRERFLDACHCRATDRPPVWLMRQAGRALPEYRKLKEKHSFLELVQTPELAAEVTLQPIRRFDFDAAVLFSDILVVAEGLGQSYAFRDGAGIKMAFALRSAADIDRLDTQAVNGAYPTSGGALVSLSSLGGELLAPVFFLRVMSWPFHVFAAGLRSLKCSW